jgi:hypothetical protein
MAASICSQTNVAFLNNLLTGVIDAPGICLNLFTLICLFQLLRGNDNFTHHDTRSTKTTRNLFRYLLVKALCDALFFLNDIIYLVYSCGPACAMWGSRAGVNWLLYVYIDLNNLLLMISSMMTLAATLGMIYLK